MGPKSTIKTFRSHKRQMLLKYSRIRQAVSLYHRITIRLPLSVRTCRASTLLRPGLVGMLYTTKETMLPSSFLVSVLAFCHHMEGDTWGRGIRGGVKSGRTNQLNTQYRLSSATPSVLPRPQQKPASCVPCNNVSKAISRILNKHRTYRRPIVERRRYQIVLFVDAVNFKSTAREAMCALLRCFSRAFYSITV